MLLIIKPSRDERYTNNRIDKLALVKVISTNQQITSRPPKKEHQYQKYNLENYFQYLSTHQEENLLCNMLQKIKDFKTEKNK